MYFTIPDTTEVSAKNSSNHQAHTLFNIHVNGVHHCSLRYSQLYTFNEELHRLLANAMTNVDAFPPKKFFTLSPKETEERRVLLEHYLQSLVQNKFIITSSYFNEFFFNAQRETFTTKSFDFPEKVDLKVCLLNKHEIILDNLSTNTKTSNVLDTCAAKIQLQSDFSSYFALYLYYEIDNQLNILRPLYDFECPYITFEQTKKIYENSLIILKKSYWDFNFDLQLINDRRARNLLIVQAQYEVEESQHLYPSDIYQQLDVLYENKSYKDYLSLARTSKFYGHIFLRQCSILYPINNESSSSSSSAKEQKLCQCLVAIGNNEILCCINSSNEKKKMKETSFKVTRIRCWKVNRTKQEISISLEYLFNKDNLQWITIHTQQAPLVSTCLQSMVDEILAKKTGTTTPVPLTSTVLPSSTTATVTSTEKSANGLKTRTLSELERLNNNGIFDRGEHDDDL